MMGQVGDARESSLYVSLLNTCFGGKFVRATEKSLLETRG